MVITGRIYDIIHITDKVSQIVLKKKDRDKIVPVAIKVMGYWKDKALNEMKLKPKDKIKANVYMVSRKSKTGDMYYTDVFFREIFLVEPAPIQMQSTFFDQETGEVFDD